MNEQEHAYEFTQDDAVPAELYLVNIDGKQTIAIPKNTLTGVNWKNALRVANIARERGASIDEQVVADQATNNAYRLYYEEQSLLYTEACNYVLEKQQQGERVLILSIMLKIVPTAELY
jgi:hypothetical protein